MEIRNNEYLTQSLVAIVATIIMFSSSVNMGWASPTIPKLLNPDSPIQITSDEGSWVVSVSSFGTAISVIPILFLSSRFGRKTFLLHITIPLLTGWTLIVFAQSVVELLIARILFGYAYGCSVSILPIYLAEISSKNIRGTLTNLSMIMQQCAILYTFIIAPYVSIRLMACIGMIPVFIFIALFIWCPESPYYLIKNDKPIEAEKNLKKLRGYNRNQSSDNLEKELNDIKECLAKFNSKGKQEYLRQFQEVLLPKNRKKIALMIVLASLRHFTGSHTIIVYAETLFDRVKSPILPSTASIIMGVGQLATCLISIRLVDRFGRRPILFTSLIAVIICDLILAIYFFVSRFYDDNIESVSIFIVVIIIVCNASFTFGIALIPSIVFGEIFPQNLKPFSGAIYVIVASMMAVIMLKIFQIVSDDIGTDCIFLIFTLLGCLCLPYFWYCLPETKCKSLAQIQEDKN